MMKIERFVGTQTTGLKNNMFGIQFNIQVSNSQSPEAETLRGRNKNGKSLFDDLNNFLNSPSSPDTKKEIGLIQHDDYTIYPVPSSEIITVKYNFVGNEDATMQIFDILGRLIETIQLKNENTIISFSVLNIPNGVYTYKIKVGKETKTGKIQILK